MTPPPPPRAGDLLAITAVGGVSSVGLGIVETCAAIRAGFNRFEQQDTYHALPPDGDDGDDAEPAVAASIPDLDPDLDDHRRLMMMAMGALSDLFAMGGLARTTPSHSALLLALPARAAAGADALAAAACDRLGLPRFAVCRAGSAGTASALQLAHEGRALLASAAVDRCIVLGVDSWVTRDQLAALDRAGRLKSARNVDGFIPGEGAAAFQIENVATAMARGARPLALLTGAGVGREPNPIASDRQSGAVGLTAAFRQVLLDSPAPPGGAWLLCDLNGESYRAYEWALVRSRLGPLLGEPADLTHPIDCLGDVGAATGAFLVGCACAAFGRGYAPAATALLWGAGDGGERVVVRLTAPS